MDFAILCGPFHRLKGCRPRTSFLHVADARPVTARSWRVSLYSLFDISPPESLCSSTDVRLDGSDGSTAHAAVQYSKLQVLVCA